MLQWAVEQKAIIYIRYEGGSTPGKVRHVLPVRISNHLAVEAKPLYNAESAKKDCWTYLLWRISEVRWVSFE